MRIATLPVVHGGQVEQWAFNVDNIIAFREDGPDRCWLLTRDGTWHPIMTHWANLHFKLGEPERLRTYSTEGKG